MFEKFKKIQNSKFHGFILTLAAITFLVACNKQPKDIQVAQQDTIRQISAHKIGVRYIKKICCGNMLTLENNLVSCTGSVYEDSLLRAINLDEFVVSQNLQFGDTLTIEFELTEYCEASCELTCNRMNGIPIHLISVE